MKCSKCNRESDHCLGGVNLCRYHYWKVKPWACFDWKGYKIMHPVKISQWRKADKTFDKYLRKQGIS